MKKRYQKNIVVSVVVANGAVLGKRSALATFEESNACLYTEVGNYSYSIGALMDISYAQTILTGFIQRHYRTFSSIESGACCPGSSMDRRIVEHLHDGFSIALSNCDNRSAFCKRAGPLLGFPYPLDWSGGLVNRVCAAVIVRRAQFLANSLGHDSSWSPRSDFLRSPSANFFQTFSLCLLSHDKWSDLDCCRVQLAQIYNPPSQPMRKIIRLSNVFRQEWHLYWLWPIAGAFCRNQPFWCFNERWFIPWPFTPCCI